MTEYDIRTIVLQELPLLIEQDIHIRESVVRLVTPYFAPRYETESHFDRMLGELRHMREESERKWAESKRQWDEQQALNHKMLAEIGRVDKKIDQKIGAIGARWGIDSETAFRNGLRGILQAVANVQVLNVNEYDDEGIVFGRPDQVELDIVIRNGLLVVCEMKSSVSKGDIATFERKIQFYQKRHQRTVSQKIIISPMVDPRALPLAQTLGIMIYHNAEDVVLDKEDI